MPTIVAVEARVHNPSEDSSDPQSYAGKNSFLFVRLRVRLSDGREGEGFTGRFLASQVAHFLNADLAEAIRGRDPLEDPDLLADLAARFNPRGMTGVVVSALSALDIALHDLRAKAANVPLSVLLGAARLKAPVYVTCGFPALSTDQLVEACAAEVAGGAAGVKVLVGGSFRTLAQDADRLRAVRGAVGDACLIADANCAYNLDAAREFQSLTADLALTWFEEPVERNDVRDLARLVSDNVHPIGAGQMEQSEERFRQLLEAGVDTVQPNAVFCGGIGAAVALATAAVAENRRVSPAAGWDLVNLHWMCGVLADGPVELHRAHDRIACLLTGGPPKIRHGCVAPPTRSGLGLAPDEQGLSACAV